ncbi:complement C1s subcomponent-like isoform X2 [Colossoma macropomum]|uniref:complement C1s subcomponent-like isoform X2 n=1 Tax=Colossoma macropomum TaxID=42526 RepID=UPI001863A878|nr:complement C1s subcomponent-like isoform X2 [Colossoma macropomum]
MFEKLRTAGKIEHYLPDCLFHLYISVMGRIKLIMSLLWMSVCECKAAMYGHVQSPLFPEPYLADLYIRWYLKVPHGYQIQLTFNHLDIEPSVNCTKDSLTILLDGEVLGKFCGQKSTDTHHPGNKPILSPDNHLWLLFETDSSNQGSQMHLGFFVFYQAIVVDCGIPEIADPDLIALTEESLLTTYKQNISFKCLSEYYKLDGDVCGMNKQTFSAGRVFGGQDAKLGQIPWQLLTKQPNRGGASLISDRWAITAATVVDGQQTKTLLFYGGMIDGLDQNAVKMETEKIIIHPGYKVESPVQTNYDNDIALVKMSARVPLSTNVLPVCLPEKSNGPVMEGKSGTVSGFGGTSKNPLRSRFLQHGPVKEYSEVPCFSTTLKVTDNMFCAGGDDEDVDTCKGDSGGPLVIPLLGRGSPETPYRLKGIVSWGPAKCGDKNFKGYYTKVENYLDWIRETMENN